MAATGGEAKSDGESDVEQYELTEDEEEQQQGQQEDKTPSKSHTGKRKRSLSQNDEEEIARRRRRRRSLAFQQRRRSLTPSERGQGGSSAAPAHSKQYISDMYSTIIKMSSENKINVKNSWSLHLIDHMEDILDSSKRNAADGEVEDDTYNFQKASCTLDASIKIYSYRVDDTWNSSYKILENLSRTEQKHGVDEVGSDGEQRATKRKSRKTHARTIEKNLNNINLKAYDTECEADPLFHKMSQSFDEGGAKGMLLANLSVYDGCKILLNSSDVSVVTRKPIHETENKSQKEELESQAKKDAAKPDEAANGQQNEADTASDLDAGKKEDEGEGEEASVESEEKEDATEGDDTMEGNTSQQKEGSGEDATMEAESDKKKESSTEDVEMEKEKGDSSEDVTTEEEQSKENEEPTEGDVKDGEDADATQASEEGANPPAAKERISISLFGSLSCIDQDVQSLSVCPPLHRMYDQLDEFYGDESRHKVGIKTDFLLKTPVKGRRMTLDKKDAVALNLAGIMEGASEDESDAEDAAHDTSVDFGDDNAAYDADDDGEVGGEGEETAEAEPTEDVDMEQEKDIIDLAGSDDEESQEDVAQDGTEMGAKSLDKEQSLTSTAADFFRSKVNENLPENYENNLFSQMIESALVRSTTLEDEQGGEDLDGKNDYSYFDVKMLRNWAGPGHWKFPAVRKLQRLKDEAEKEALAGEVDEDGVLIKSEPTERPPERTRKGSSAGADKKAAVLVDFFGEEPDLSRLKAPKSVSSLEVSKGSLKKQEENASDLVLPVDTHIEIGLFFRHFLKERPRFFRKRGGGGVDGANRKSASSNQFEYGEDSGDAAIDNDREQPFTYNEDSAGFDVGYDDEDETTSGVDDPATETLYSAEGLVQADRVVEKIGVHYERFAKRVDVKKLKGSIWDHLEKKVVKSEEKVNAAGVGDGDDVEKPADADKTNEEADTAVSLNESGKRPREPDADEKDEEPLDTTFENVVENVAGKVPSNVTVSFYFICVLHLANEKGLELVGQDDLRNFQIRKENA